MKSLLPIFFWLCPLFAKAQAKAPASRGGADTITGTNKLVQQKPEILSSGFIDIVNNGQINASARFIRLYIGEPGRFSIPLSIYSGVSSNNFQNQQLLGGQQSNEQLILHFINLLSGLANISTEGHIFFRRKPVKVTRTGLLYQFGLRVLTGYKAGLVTNPLVGKPINFLNNFGSTGIYFQYRAAASAHDPVGLRPAGAAGVASALCARCAERPGGGGHGDL